MKIHHYSASITWQGNLGSDTANYTAYSRNHQISSSDKPPIAASADPSFIGDPSRYNPEELLLASLASCHMLWYLHLCSEQQIRVVSYCDHPKGIMEESPNGAGKFKQVTLRPEVVIRNSKNLDLALTLHEMANKNCFIANSCNFPVVHFPKVTVFKEQAS